MTPSNPTASTEPQGNRRRGALSGHVRRVHGPPPSAAVPHAARDALASLETGVGELRRTFARAHAEPIVAEHVRRLCGAIQQDAQRVAGAI